MILNDGFGDHLSITEAIAQREPLISIMAAERAVPTSEWEDARQEARITFWRVLTDRPESSPAYVHKAMGRRIIEVSTRGTWTGYVSHRGYPIDPLRRRDRDSLDDPDLFFEASSPEVLDSVLLAYHEGEILAAINALPPAWREYVILRFWGGWTNAEISARQGTKLANVARTWNEAIRPRLRE